MFKVAPCQGVLQKTEFGILWNCFKVQHGNWIVATRCLLDSLCWKKCSCLNINIFIRRCAVPSSCAQPHQSASCFDQPVSCAGIFIHFAITSTIWKPLPSDGSDNDPWDRTFSISAIAGKWFSYDRYNRCDRWTFFISAIAEITWKSGLSVSWKCG